MLNDMSFCFYYKMQGIKSAKMIAKLEWTCQHGRLTYLFFARRRGIQMTGALVVCHTGKISRHP